MIIILVIIFFIVVLLDWFRLYRETKKFNINGPVPLPLIGNAHLFVVKSTEFLDLVSRLSVKYGSAFRVHFFSRPYVFICHPKHAEEILSSTTFITKGSAYELFHCLFGKGLLVSTGDKWKFTRKLLTPAFHFTILQNFLPIFCKNQRILVQKLRSVADGRSVDLIPFITLASLDNMLESIMGVTENLQENGESEYCLALKESMQLVAKRWQIPLLANDFIFNLLPYKTRLDKALKIVHDKSNKVIEARRNELKNAHITGLDKNCDTGIKNKHAFLDLLLLADSSLKIDDNDVRQEVDTFMVESHDTSTSGVLFALYLLSQHKDVQDKVYEELQTIYGADIDRDPTYNELNQMKYLDMVIKESLRLYPSVPHIDRTITEDCVVGDLTLTKGTTVGLMLYHMQRNEDLFEDPLQFKPERFESPLKSSFSWVAFSAGPRNCIGQKFAMMELKVFISEIVKHFEMLPTGKEPKLGADLVLKSHNGINVKLIPRK